MRFLWDPIEGLPTLLSSGLCVRTRLLSHSDHHTKIKAHDGPANPWAVATRGLRRHVRAFWLCLVDYHISRQATDVVPNLRQAFA